MSMEEVQQIYLFFNWFFRNNLRCFLLSIFFISCILLVEYHFYLQPLLSNKAFVASKIEVLKEQLYKKRYELAHYVPRSKNSDFLTCKFFLRMGSSKNNGELEAESVGLSGNHKIDSQNSTILWCQEKQDKTSFSLDTKLKRKTYLLLTNYQLDFFSETFSLLSHHTIFLPRNSSGFNDLLMRYSLRELRILGILTSDLLNKQWALIALPNNTIYKTVLHDKIGSEQAEIVLISAKKISLQENNTKKEIELFVGNKEA